MNLRELVSTSLISSHLETQPHESAIDRIGALARASDLGRALFHWGYAGDATSARSAFKHLLRKAQRKTRIYKHHQDFSTLQKICLMVLHEWKYPACQHCGGLGEIEANFEMSGKGNKAACVTCSGTGKHRYSDHWRMGQLGIEQKKYSQWERHISAVWTCLSGADVGAVITCRAQLERA